MQLGANEKLTEEQIKELHQKRKDGIYIFKDKIRREGIWKDGKFLIPSKKI